MESCTWSQRIDVQEQAPGTREAESPVRAMQIRVIHSTPTGGSHSRRGTSTRQATETDCALSSAESFSISQKAVEGTHPRFDADGSGRRGRKRWMQGSKSPTSKRGWSVRSATKPPPTIQASISLDIRR